MPRLNNEPCLPITTTSVLHTHTCTVLVDCFVTVQQHRLLLRIPYLQFCCYNTNMCSTSSPKLLPGAEKRQMTEHEVFHGEKIQFYKNDLNPHSVKERVPRNDCCICRVFQYCHCIQQERIAFASGVCSVGNVFFSEISIIVDPCSWIYSPSARLSGNSDNVVQNLELFQSLQ